MFIPERHSGVKKWVVSRKWLRNGLIAVLGFFAFSFASIYSSVKQTLHPVAQLSGPAKNMLLEGQVERLQKQLKTAQLTLSRLENFEQKLRAMARFKESDLAIGPLSKEEQKIIDDKYLGFASESGQANLKDMSALELATQSIHQKASLREQSLQHLYELLRDESSLIASTPSIWPVRGWISSHYGTRVSPFTGALQSHHGVDIPAPTGTKVVAPADGVVIRAGTESGYGKLLSIRHGYGIVTRYGHNSKLLVKVGQKVKRGQKVSEVGSTGRSTAPHLHYEVRINGVPVNPAKYMID